MEIELANCGLPGAKAGCSKRGLLLGCDISYNLVNRRSKDEIFLILDSHVTNTKKLVANEMAQEAGVVMFHFRHTRLTNSSLGMGPFSDRLGNTSMMH